MTRRWDPNHKKIWVTSDERFVFGKRPIGANSPPRIMQLPRGDLGDQVAFVLFVSASFSESPESRREIDPRRLPAFERQRGLVRSPRSAWLATR